MKALIVAAGELPGKELLRERAGECELWIAADAGLLAYEAADMMPQLLVGDMDSVPQESLRRYMQAGGACIQTAAEKNDTDAFLALEEAVARDADEVAMLGATGERADHFLSNLMLLKWAAQKNVRLVIEDDKQTIEWMDGEFEIFGRQGQTISILPAGECACVTAKGLYYPLEELLLTDARPRGVSNVFQEGRAMIQTDRPVLIVKVK